MERERSPLRARAVDFRLTFSQTQALKSFFDNVHNNLKELEVSVVKSAAFEGFQVDSMNDSHSVVLNGRLAAEVELNLPQASFCVVVTFCATVNCAKLAICCVVQRAVAPA